jgi:polar amino acid transport system substrate-binding protein
MRLMNCLIRVNLTCTATMLSALCHAGTLTVCMPDEDYPPVILMHKDGQAQWLARKAIESQGDAIKLVPVPWRRCIDGAKKGTYDAALPPAINPQFLPELVFPMKGGEADVSRGVAVLSNMAVRRVGSPAGWDGTTFKAVSGPILLKGGSFVQLNKLRAMGMAFDDGSKNTRNVLRKLLAQRGEIALVPSNDIEHLLQEPEFQGKVEMLPAPFITASIFLAFNRKCYEKSTAHLEAIWNEIKRLRNSREFEEMSKGLKE